MKIVSLDLSLTGTGICVVDADASSLILLDVGTIKTTPKDGGLYQRFDLILEKLHTAGTFDPKNTVLIGIEGYAFGKSDRGLLDRAELRGVILHKLHLLQIPHISIAPQSMKKFVSGSGNLKKNMIPMHVQQKFATEFLAAGIELRDDNQADAVGLAAMTFEYRHWLTGRKIGKELEKVFQRIKENS